MDTQIVHGAGTATLTECPHSCPTASHPIPDCDHTTGYPVPRGDHTAHRSVLHGSPGSLCHALQCSATHVHTQSSRRDAHCPTYVTPHSPGHWQCGVCDGSITECGQGCDGYRGDVTPPEL